MSDQGDRDKADKYLCDRPYDMMTGVRDDEGTLLLVHGWNRQSCLGFIRMGRDDGKAEMQPTIDRLEGELASKTKLCESLNKYNEKLAKQNDRLACEAELADAPEPAPVNLKALREAAGFTIEDVEAAELVSWPLGKALYSELENGSYSQVMSEPVFGWIAAKFNCEVGEAREAIQVSRAEYEAQQCE